MKSSHVIVNVKTGSSIEKLTLPTNRIYLQKIFYEGEENDMEYRMYLIGSVLVWYLDEIEFDKLNNRLTLND